MNFSSGSERPNLLLIEDQPDTVGFMLKVLSEEGFAVEAATTFHEAQARLATKRYAAILADLGLPDGDGRELVKNPPNAHRTPCIAVTAYNSTEEMERCLTSGFAGFVAKPINVLSLITTINGVIAAEKHH